MLRDSDFVSTDRLLGLVGLTFAFLGLTEMYRLWMNCCFLAAGLALILWGLWKWERFEAWRPLKKIICMLRVVSLYCAVVAYPVEQQYEREIAIGMTFKDSPQFTWWRRQVITHDFAKARDYFVAFGIETPKEIPPLGVRSGSGGSSNPPGLPLYRTVQWIGKDQVKDRRAVTSIYINITVWDVLAKNSKWVVSPEDIARFLVLQMTFSSYFNGSVWDKAPVPGDFMLLSLWKIREQCGAAFTDKLVAYALKSISDNPEEVSDPDTHIYLARKLKIADSIVESDMSKWPQISNIIRDDGISIDRI
jgi:hypothetical protein